MELKILSWNIWRGQKFPEVVETLRRLNADIIGLQEVIEIPDDPLTNQAKLIAEELGYDWTFAKSVESRRPGKFYNLGNAVLSKTPIIQSTRTFLSQPENYDGNSTTEPRTALAATIEIDRQPLHFITTHLAYSHQLAETAIKTAQLEKLLPLLPSSRTVLLGDFNSLPHSQIIHTLENILLNAESNSAQPTWSVYPTNYKGFEVSGLEYKIDYIFSSKDLALNNYTLEKSLASDHLPISVKLEVP